MNAEQVKKIAELVNSNAEVQAQLENTESVEDIVKVLSENGIEVSAEEILAGINAAEGEDGELSEEDLENVAGGYCAKGRNWKCFWSFMKGYVGGIIEGLTG